MSPLVGGSFGILRTGQEAIQTYISMKWIFSATDTLSMSILGSLSVINMFPNFSFAGIYNINCIDALIGRLWKRDFGAKEMVAFTLAVGGATYLAFWKRPLNLLFYGDVRSDLGLSESIMTDQVLEGASWAMFAQDISQGTACLYVPMYDIVNYVCNKAVYFAHSIGNLFFREIRSLLKNVLY